VVRRADFGNHCTRRLKKESVVLNRGQGAPILNKLTMNIEYLGTWNDYLGVAQL